MYKQQKQKINNTQQEKQLEEGHLLHLCMHSYLLLHNPLVVNVVTSQWLWMCSHSLSL